MTRQNWLCKGEPINRIIGGVTPILSRALNRRGITDEIKAWEFLHPQNGALSNPFSLTDMDKATARIELASKRGEKVCVYGDFDADGVSATAIMTDCLRSMGLETVPYIPSRHSEGYGMNMDSVRRIASWGVKLIVTVDNGISAIDEIYECMRLNMDVVVLDHHKCHEQLPSCCAVVCTSRDGYQTRKNELCGAGVALMAALALIGEQAYRYLPLAALATVADAVSITGENRTIVARGMMNAADNLGLSCLMRAAGVLDCVVDETMLAYALAPRMNAAGRMGDAMCAVELLLCKDRIRAEQIAKELDDRNTARRQEEQRIMDECLSLTADKTVKGALILRGKDWNSGVIGIVASRLCERYGCPTVLLTQVEDGTLRGSGRSVEGVDLFDTLSKCSQHLIRFGGHCGAAGVSLQADRYDDFCAAFISQLVNREYSFDYSYEESITLDECTVDNARSLQSLAPFGSGNEEPVFLIEDCQILNVASMGKDGKHLSMMINKEGRSARVVAFNRGDMILEWSTFGRADLLVRMRENVYKGNSSCQLILVSIRKCFESEKN
ncbi:MAG: single-stranded-DNA-specific exonuclease RecJ [Eubacteriales bacterium]|nr:single-stranded-DNA-specific exonuclease RecJ [Eubacteriales bacterium]